MLGRFQRWRDSALGPSRLGLLLSGVVVVVIVSALVVFHSRPPVYRGDVVKVGTSISLWPDTAGPGSTITVSGAGYLSHEALRVYFQRPEQGVIHTVTDAEGDFFVPLMVPKTYVRGVQYFVHVESSTSSTQRLFSFTPLHLSPSDAHGQLSFGSLVLFGGAGFVANETIDLMWDDGASARSKAGTVVAGSDGSFSIPLTMPSVPSHAHVLLEAFGRTSGFSTSIALTTSPGIVLTPSSGSAGTRVSLDGGSFGRNEIVTVFYLGTLVTTTRTNSEGAFTASFTLADSDQIGYLPDAIQAFGKTSGMSAAVPFVSQPSVTIAPTSGKAGTKITVKGNHFVASATLNIYWVDDSQGGSGNQTFLGNVRVSSKGTFTITITAPAGVVKGGVYFVQAIDQATGKGAQAQFGGK